jgi:hypothetical protein
MTAERDAAKPGKAEYKKKRSLYALAQKIVDNRKAVSNNNFA